MNSAVSSLTLAAIEKAESRSSILHELSKAYGKKTVADANESESKIASTVTVNTDSLTSKPGGLNPGYFDVLQRFISDPKDKTRRFLSESLYGKSIVLSNAKPNSSKSINKRSYTDTRCCIAYYFHLCYYL